MKNKNYLRQKINYNNSTEVMGEGGGGKNYSGVYK